MFKKKRKGKKSVLVLWYPVGCNFGDFLIYETVRSYLADWNFDVVGMDVGLPYTIIAKEAKKHDWLWFAGGGIIERGIPDVIRNFEKFRSDSKRIQYGITGLSIGDFNYDEFTSPLTCWVKNAAFFYTRDEYSAHELNKIAKGNYAIPSVDVCFAFRGIPKIPDVHKNVLGVNFRDLPYKDLTGEFCWKEWESAIQECIEEEIIGIPDQYDYENRMRFKMASTYSPESVMNALTDCDYTIAMRYHILLMTARLGKICLSICYCPKVSRLAEQLGLEELRLGVHEYDRLAEKVNKYKKNQSYYEENVRKNVAKMECQAKEMFEKVQFIMEDK